VGASVGLHGSALGDLRARGWGGAGGPRTVAAAGSAHPGPARSLALLRLRRFRRPPGALGAEHRQGARRRPSANIGQGTTLGCQMSRLRGFRRVREGARKPEPEGRIRPAATSWAAGGLRRSTSSAEAPKRPAGADGRAETLARRAFRERDRGGGGLPTPRPPFTSDHRGCNECSGRWTPAGPGVRGAPRQPLKIGPPFDIILPGSPLGRMRAGGGQI
jgi:hypothetical protein